MRTVQPIPTTKPITVDCATLENDISTPVEVEVEELKELEEKKKKKHELPTRKFMRERYQVGNKSINIWCNALEIWRPGREGSFSQDDVNLLDDLWIANKVFRLTLNEFVNLIFLPKEIQVPFIAEKELENAAKLDRFVYRKHNRCIEGFLQNNEDFKYHRIVLDKLQRIKELKQQLTANKTQPSSNQ